MSFKYNMNTTEPKIIGLTSAQIWIQILHGNTHTLDIKMMKQVLPDFSPLQGTFQDQEKQNEWRNNNNLVHFYFSSHVPPQENRY